MQAQLEYGNWIRRKNLIVLGLCTLGVGALVFIPLGSLYRTVAVIVFAVVLVSFLYPLYAYVMFSQKGGGLQERIYDLISERLGKDAEGRVLDIGSGNGVLAVKLAQQHSGIKVVGVDYWGADWEYSKSVCEKNARSAGVQERVSFQKADAAKLDFANDTFDGAVSNLTFHEVKSVADKKAVVQEALRVVKKGGRFAFVDYLNDEKYYGTKSEFEKFLSEMNPGQVRLEPLTDVIEIPLLLRHPKILGRVAILYGKK